MASFRELKRDFGTGCAMREAWDSFKWYFPNLIGWLFVIFDEREPRTLKDES